MKFLLKVALIAAAAAIIFMISCGDKSTGAADTDALADGLQTQTTTLVNNMGFFIGDGIGFIDDGVGSLAKPADTTYFTYDSDSYWWVYYREVGLTDPFVWNIAELDSIRFLDGAEYQETPNDSTDGLQFRITGNEEMIFASDSTMNLEYDFDCDYANAHSDTINADGEMAYDMDVIMGNLEYGYQFGCEYNDIVFYSDPYGFDDHPVSGTMAIEVAIHSNGDVAQSLPEGTFAATITLTFTSAGYEGQMTIEGDDYTWETTWDDVHASPVYGDH